MKTREKLFDIARTEYKKLVTEETRDPATDFMFAVAFRTGYELGHKDGQADLINESVKMN